MSAGYWDQVQAAGFEVPDDRPLDDLTAELTTMLGLDPTRGPRRHRLPGAGHLDRPRRLRRPARRARRRHGRRAGGRARRDRHRHVFRRSFSALILAECLERDNEQHLLPGAKILDWGDRIAIWFLTRARHPRLRARQGLGARHRPRRRRDRRAGESPHLAGAEHTVLLDVLAERLLLPADAPLASPASRTGSPRAAMQVLRRNTGPRHRRARALGAPDRRGGANPFARPGRPRPLRRHATTPQAFLRALYLQLSLGARAARRAPRPAAGRDRRPAHAPTRTTCGSHRLASTGMSRRHTEISGHSGELAVARRPRPRRRDDVHPLGRPRLPDVRRARSRRRDPQMRLLDVRHEQTAAFAAEATGKLTRVPGLAVLTAGPGVTNGVSAIAQAQFAGSPMVVVGGRAPQNRWGTGCLQELDQPPIIAPVAKSAKHPARPPPRSPPAWTRPSRWPGPATAARSSSTYRWTSSSTPPTGSRRLRRGRPASSPTPTRSRAVAAAARPAPSARCSSSAPTCGPTAPRSAALRFVEDLGIPTLTNGMGRGVIPGGHPLARHQGPRRRRSARRRPGRRRRHPARLPPRLRRLRRQGPGGAFAKVVHIADSPGQVSGHAELAGSVVRRPHHGPRRPRRPRSSAAASPTGARGPTELAGPVRGRRRARRRSC